MLVAVVSVGVVHLETGLVEEASFVEVHRAET